VVFIPYVERMHGTKGLKFSQYITESQWCCYPVGCGRPDHNQQHCYHHAPKVKPEAATAVVELLMMGMRTPETC